MSENNPTELEAVKAASLAPMSIKDTVLAQFKEAETTVNNLAKRYFNVVFDVKTPKGMKEAIAARADLRDNGRLFLTRAETRIKGEVNDLKRVMADEVGRLVAIVKPVEDAIDQQIKAEETRKAEEKAERERIEAERVAKHQANIDKLKSYVERAKGQPIEAIEKAIQVLSDFPIGAEYEEFEEQAQAARNSTVEALRSMVVAERDRIAKESEAARVAAELAAAKAELEALRQQQAEAERLRIAQEQVAIAKQEEEQRSQQVAEAAARAADVVKQAAMSVAAPVIDKPAPVVTQPAPNTGSGETIKLGDINARLAPISVTAAGLSELGFEPVGTDKNAKLYRESTFDLICRELVKHIQNVAQTTA